MVDAGSKLQSHKGTEFIYQIRQSNNSLLVQMQQFPLIQVLIQEKIFAFQLEVQGESKPTF